VFLGCVGGEFCSALLCSALLWALAGERVSSWFFIGSRAGLQGVEGAFGPTVSADGLDWAGGF
jgi:hypothetical protein